MTAPSSRLGPAERAQALETLDSERFDIVVVGAGITGAGAALDAASRGLRVALVEQRDIASGTSSRSSKLIHGGLRYLEQFNFGLVREALHERGLLLGTIAPHLVRPVPFLYPLRHRVWERPYVGAGVALYDILAGLADNPLPRHRHLSRTQALAQMPALRRDALVGAVQYWDASTDDARFTLFVARTAASLGAVVASSTRVTGFRHEDGRIAGVTARCLETGRHLEIQSRVVVNATGVWTDETQAVAGVSKMHTTASKGIHLVVPRERIPAESGVILRTPSSVLFVIPWGRHQIIGTTDTAWNLDLAHPAASRSDIDYLLGQLNTMLHEPLRHTDIQGVYAGLRPLLTGETDHTSRLSREHAVAVTAPGMVTVAGGKYTTYRVMARDAIDAAVGDLGDVVPPSRTHQIPLVGADNLESATTEVTVRVTDHLGLPESLAGFLLQRYGSYATDVLDLIDQRPELGATLPGTDDYLEAEVLYAAAEEAALHLNDVLTRRTRLSIETWDRGTAAAPRVAELMAEVHGWDGATVERELAHYRARVEAERQSQQMGDDATADAARLGAPDVRTLGE
jgi:glycerol-3-phosphate dehydrogenase